MQTRHSATVKYIALAAEGWAQADNREQDEVGGGGGTVVGARLCCRIHQARTDAASRQWHTRNPPVRGEQQMDDIVS